MLGLLMLWQSVEGPLLQLVGGPLEARPPARGGGPSSASNLRESDGTFPSHHFFFQIKSIEK